MKKEDSSLPNDVRLGTAYISPHKGTQTELSRLQNLTEDITTFKNHGEEVILQGRLNARTSNMIQP